MEGCEIQASSSRQFVLAAAALGYRPGATPPEAVGLLGRCPSPRRAAAGVPPTPGKPMQLIANASPSMSRTHRKH